MVILPQPPQRPQPRKGQIGDMDASAGAGFRRIPNLPDVEGESLFTCAYTVYMYTCTHVRFPFKVGEVGVRYPKRL